MEREELKELVAELLRRQNELDDVEVKSARNGAPKVYDSLSAMANRAGGGTLIFGLDEAQDFEPVGVYDLNDLQRQVHEAATQMEPPIRPLFQAIEIKGKTVLGVEVPECPYHLKPCYYKPQGMYHGSYIRVGDSDRRMTEYEIYLHLSARKQPQDDTALVERATINDLDSRLIGDLFQIFRANHPESRLLQMPEEERLKALNIVGVDREGDLHPTLAGLLLFGRFPQQFYPSLFVSYVFYPGTSRGKEGSKGERFLDNRRFDGTIPEMIEAALTRIRANMRRSTLINGLFREELDEYPGVAIREALLNALAHRDYSHYAQGTHVEIRMFADRLEIENPGGLYGYLTEELLGQGHHATRNAALVRLLEDLRLVENRGSGIQAMIEAMRNAQMMPPKFRDKRSSFVVTFMNHTLLDEETISWLNQFGKFPMNDRQRLALAYLRSSEHITNKEYQVLNSVESKTATGELQALVKMGLLRQYGIGRGTRYSINGEIPPAPALLSAEEEAIIDYVNTHGSIRNEECRNLLGVDARRAQYLLGKLVTKGLLRHSGSRRGRVYLSRRGV